MATEFNVDLPPRFVYNSGMSVEENMRVIGDYVYELHSSLEDMFHRAYFRLLDDTLSSKIISFSRASDAASGTQDVTGFGFQPKTVLFRAVIAEDRGCFCDGYDNASEHMCTYSNYNNVTGEWDKTDTHSIYIDNIGGGGGQKAYISSMGVDGFTLTWATMGSPPSGTIYVHALAMK